MAVEIFWDIGTIYLHESYVNTLNYKNKTSLLLSFFFLDSSPFCFFSCWMQLQKSSQLFFFYYISSLHFSKAGADFFLIHLICYSSLHIVFWSLLYKRKRDRIFQFGSSTITSSDNFYLLPKFTNSEIQPPPLVINISVGNFYLWGEGFLEKYLIQ